MIVIHQVSFVLPSERAVSLSLSKNSSWQRVGSTHLPHWQLILLPLPHKSINPFLHSPAKWGGWFHSLLSLAGREEGVGESPCPLAETSCEEHAENWWRRCWGARDGAGLLGSAVRCCWWSRWAKARDSYGTWIQVALQMRGWSTVANKQMEAAFTLKVRHKKHRVYWI